MKKRQRPHYGDHAALRPGASIRDAAAVLGISKTELAAWCKLAAIPEADFERHLAASLATDPKRTSARRIMSMHAGNPSRARDNKRRTFICCPHCGEVLTDATL